MTSEDYARPARDLTAGGISRGLPPAPPRSRMPPKKVVAMGIGAALALGLLFGLLAKPDLSVFHERPMQPAAQTPAAGGLDIVVHRAVPPPAPKSAGGKLEVLPNHLAAAAPKAPAPQPSFRQAAAETVGDLVPPRQYDEAVDDSPIDCARPAGWREARICRDIGFDRQGADVGESYSTLDGTPLYED